MDSPRPMTSDERLRHVAKIIRNTPERWDQMTYSGTIIADHLERPHRSLPDIPALRDRPRILMSIGVGDTCDTPCCVAGWAVRTSTAEEVEEILDGTDPLLARRSPWFLLAGPLLGLPTLTAEVLFSGGLCYLRPGEMARILEALAAVPPSERTVEVLRDAGPLSRRALLSLKRTLTMALQSSKNPEMERYIEEWGLEEVMMGSSDAR